MIDQPTAWRRESWCRKLSREVFGDFVLPLTVVIKYKPEDEAVTHLLSGSMVYAFGQLYWVTSGHIIEALKTVVADERCKIKACQWSDTYPLRAAQSIPANLPDLLSQSHYANTDDRDIAIVRINDNHAALLASNPRLHCLTEKVWTLDPKSKGRRYLVGFPKELVSCPLRIIGTRREGDIKAPCIVMPLKPTPRQSTTHSEFWRGKDCQFYKTLAFSDSKTYPVESVNGMSGGPVFVVRRVKGDWVYKLIGIQRAENKTRVVKVEPFAKVLKMIKRVAAARRAGQVAG